MSLILDALKKAESERKRDEEVELPSIESNPDSEIVVNTTTPESNKNWLLPGLLILASVLIIVLAYVAFSDSNVASPNGDATGTAKTEKLVTQSPPAVDLARSAHTENEVIPDKEKESSKPNEKPIDAVAKKSKQKVESIKSELIASQYRDKPQQKEEIKNLYDAQSDSTGNSQNGAGLELKPETESKKHVLSNPPPSSAEKSEAVNQSSSDQSGIQNDTQNVAADPTLLAAYSDTKRITDLSFSVQSDIPTMMYTRHQYGGERNSIVEINGKSLRENSNAASGVRIKKILRDGIILQFKEHEFKMQALNSWINL